MEVQIVNVPVEELCSMVRVIVAEEVSKANITKDKEAKIASETIDEVLTREEVAEMLKVSTTTLWNWNNNKTLVNHKIDHRVYYMRSDVMAKFNYKTK